MPTTLALPNLALPPTEQRALFEATIEPCLPALRRHCIRLTRSSWDAEDLLQETLLKALARRHRAGDHPASYFCRIATNTWIDHLRHTRDGMTEFEKAEQAPAPRPGGLDELRDGISRLVVSLPPRQRVIFMLIEGFDFRAPEVAAMLETTEGAVKAALHRARIALRQVDPQHAEPPPQPPPNRAVVDSYIFAFQQRDAQALIALLNGSIS